MINNIFKSSLTLIVLITTVSCAPSKKDSLVNICESNPELCNDLHLVGDCNYDRTSLIRARYYDKTEPSQLHTTGLLNELDNYESCIELTLFMQFTKRQERKEQRIENLFRTQELIKDKLKELKKTKDPHLAYYLWTHVQDLHAKKVFLHAAMKKGVKDARLLIKLATLYAKEYPQYSLDTFYKALQTSQSIDDLPKNTFISIMTLFYLQKQFEQAYIWALLAEKENKEEEFPIDLDLILQKGLKNREKQILNEDALQEKANAYYQQLKEGRFNSQAPKLFL